MTVSHSNFPSLFCTLCSQYRTFVWSTLCGTCCPECAGRDLTQEQQQ